MSSGENLLTSALGGVGRRSSFGGVTSATTPISPLVIFAFFLRHRSGIQGDPALTFWSDWITGVIATVLFVS